MEHNLEEAPSIRAEEVTTTETKMASTINAPDRAKERFFKIGYITLPIITLLLFVLILLVGLQGRHECDCDDEKEWCNLQGLHECDCDDEKECDLQGLNECNCNDKNECNCNKKYYVVNAERLSFLEHLVLAQEQQCKLATVADKSEASLILGTLQEANLPSTNGLPIAWVGLMRLLDDPDSWRWVDGCKNKPVSNQLWTGIEPNGGYANEAFGGMYFKGIDIGYGWNVPGGLLDIPTNFKLPAIYECCDL